MCVAVPGRIVAIDKGNPASGPIGTVDLQGNRVKVSLVLTPEAKMDDWILVHAGFAIEIVEKADALYIWTYLNACDVGEPPTPHGSNEP